MNVLFFLEPVIFRQSPNYLTAHFIWVKEFYLTVTRMAGSFALLSNAIVCDQWLQQNPDVKDDDCYRLDGFTLLGEFNNNRAHYFCDLYGSGSISNSLSEKCQDIRTKFKPDLVVMTSQNSFVTKAFAGVAILNVEQSPLTRLGSGFRSMMDPIGHQSDSMFKRYARQIQSLPLTDKQFEEVSVLIQRVKDRAPNINDQTCQAVLAIKSIQAQGRIALFVTQPPDWVTYDGSLGRSIPLENLLCEWADSLPAGWIGVPTYHLDYQLSAGMEAALAQSRTNLRFLPRDLSCNTTEALLTVVDAMVTISSTVAMTGLLFGRKVIVTGTSPLSSWCLNKPNYLPESRQLDAKQIASTLVFLTNRYSVMHQDIQENPCVLEQILQLMTTSKQPADWFLNMSEWSIEQSYRLLNLELDSSLIAIKHNFKVVSFFTENNEYKEHAQNLINSLDKFNIYHEVHAISSDLPWEQICALKSKFMLDQWKNSDVPIVWLDADATAEAPFEVFNTCTADFAIHRWLGHEFASGTIYFGKSNTALELLERWALRCEADPNTWDQIHLESAWCDIASRGSLETQWLPRSYCQIFDGPIDTEEIVIKHWQASRIVKASGRASVLPKLNHTSLGVLERAAGVPWRTLECQFWIDNGLTTNEDSPVNDWLTYCDFGKELALTIGENLPVLEVGCGDGKVANFFAPNDYIGTDINPELLIRAKENFPKHNFRITDIGLEYPDAPSALCLNVAYCISDSYILTFMQNLIRNRKQIILIELMSRSLRIENYPFAFYREPDEYIRLFNNLGFALLRSYCVGNYLADRKLIIQNIDINSNNLYHLSFMQK
jgi:hypothetical protein